jgi:hypothetical protein
MTRLIRLHHVYCYIADVAITVVSPLCGSAYKMKLWHAYVVETRMCKTLTERLCDTHCKRTHNQTAKKDASVVSGKQSSHCVTVCVCEKHIVN